VAGLSVFISNLLPNHISAEVQLSAFFYVPPKFPPFSSRTNHLDVSVSDLGFFEKVEIGPSIFRAVIKIGL